MKKDAGGKWYWIYYASNYEPLARSSESYGTKADCEHSIALVKNSGTAPVYSE
ncbi:MAG: YegP family protein [Opitutae bacterium]|nr:YegP family protein [Opitutae bacterium]